MTVKVTVRLIIHAQPVGYEGWWISMQLVLSAWDLGSAGLVCMGPWVSYFTWWDGTVRPDTDTHNQSMSFAMPLVSRDLGSPDGILCLT